MTYDGQTASSAPAALERNGTANFAVPAADASTATALVLRLAGNARQGDAQFLVSIDGRAVTQPATVIASNALGQSQTVNLQAALTRGTHDVSVSFLNDGYSGTLSTDRNLYVKGIDVNGQAAPGTTATLMSAGTAHFQILVT